MYYAFKTPGFLYTLHSTRNSFYLLLPLFCFAFWLHSSPPAYSNKNNLTTPPYSVSRTCTRLGFMLLNQYKCGLGLSSPTQLTCSTFFSSAPSKKSVFLLKKLKNVSRSCRGYKFITIIPYSIFLCFCHTSLIPPVCCWAILNSIPSYRSPDPSVIVAQDQIKDKRSGWKLKKVNTKPHLVLINHVYGLVIFAELAILFGGVVFSSERCFAVRNCSSLSWRSAAMASGVQKLYNKVKSGAREFADSMTPTLKVNWCNCWV